MHFAETTELLMNVCVDTYMWVCVHACVLRACAYVCVCVYVFQFVVRLAGNYDAVTIHVTQSLPVHTIGESNSTQINSSGTFSGRVKSTQYKVRANHV